MKLFMQVEDNHSFHLKKKLSLSSLIESGNSGLKIYKTLNFEFMCSFKAVDGVCL